MATVKGGFWETNAGGVLTLNNPGYSSARRRAAMAFAKMRAFRELATTLNGVIAGSAASATQKRVQAAEELGGRRIIETETLVSLHPPAALACVVESPAGSREFTADGNGSFAADGIAVPVRVRVRTTEGTFVTPWVIG